MKIIVATLGVAALMAGAAAAQPMATAQGAFVDANGRTVGQARLTQTPNGVLVEADVTGLPPGEHGFHIHQTGRCEPSDKFSSAGGHFAPRGAEHGYHVEAGPHAGDMPNQVAAADGRLQARVLNDAISLTGGEGSLFDADGSALMIHAKADDYRSQPSGDAGDRLACAVLGKGGR